MPSTATHAFFAEDLYKRLDDNIKNKFKIKKFMMFAQNTDPLMFYNIMSLKRGKHIRQLQHTFHTTNVNNFFYNLITFIKSEKYYRNSDVLAFLYGFISHYSLDGNTHPYIFYKTGSFNKNDKNTFKYNGKHVYMETLIDNIFISERKTDKYESFDISKFCFDTSKFSDELNKTIDYSFIKTYDVKNMSKIYYKSLKHMKLFIHLFRKDKYKFKEIGYNFLDMLTPENTFVMSNISYNHPIIDTNNYLNEDHKVWNYSVDKNKKSDKSFYDLYSDALIESLDIISSVNDYLYNDKDIDIKKLFKNRSYTTGIDCNSKLKHKYFEF